ncbi:polymer-forming cytoskeletal protein [bacterium]|nr:polymer-forming cytoskeletal protein [bacterium]
MKDRSGTEARSGELNTIIGKGTKIKGNLNVQNSLRIDGSVVGDVHSTDTVIVGKDGEVQGQVKGKHVLLAGRVKGNIIASERVYLESKASIQGDIRATRLVVDEGAIFDGKCNMGEGKSLLQQDNQN